VRSAFVASVIKDQGHFDAYITANALIAIFTLCANICLLILCDWAYKDMVKSVLERTGGLVVQTRGQHYVWHKMWVQQVVLLIACFHFGFYLMHTRYVINQSQQSPGWHLLFIFAFLINVTILLPMNIPRITLVDGFFLLDPVALEKDFAKRRAIMSDLHYVYHLWRKCGEPELGGGKEHVLSITEFVDELNLLGFHVSREKASRMYALMDLNGDGAMSVQEFNDAMRREKLRDDAGEAAVERHTKRSPAGTPRFSLEPVVLNQDLAEVHIPVESDGTQWDGC
jgi:hypothetical protein